MEGRTPRVRRTAAREFWRTLERFVALPNRMETCTEKQKNKNKKQQTNNNHKTNNEQTKQ